MREAALDGFALGATRPREVELGEADPRRDAVDGAAAVHLVGHRGGHERDPRRPRRDRPRPRRQVRRRLPRARRQPAGRGGLRARDARAAGLRGRDRRPPRATRSSLPYNDPAGRRRGAFAAHAGPDRGASSSSRSRRTSGVDRRRRPGFLEHAARRSPARNGALLDLRRGHHRASGVARGGAQARFGVTPDLTTLGKIIGGGMPIGAYGGRADLMATSRRRAACTRPGTLSGHPLSMAAGRRDARPADARASTRGSRRPARRSRRACATRRAAAGREVAIARVGSLLTVFFRTPAPRDCGRGAAPRTATRTPGSSARCSTRASCCRRPSSRRGSSAAAHGDGRGRRDARGRAGRFAA